MTVRTRPVVTIDGPAGAGKSTVVQGLVRRLGYLPVDTGALYRSVALAGTRLDLPADDPDAWSNLAESLARQEAIQLRYEQEVLSVMLEGQDVTTAIRAQEIGASASRVSAIPKVRAALLELQRAAGRQGGVVLEGRDVGTVVFPDAEVKFFLTASVEVRAKRRQSQLKEQGLTANLTEIRREIQERDQRDSSRTVAPLRQAADAQLIDSSHLEIEEVIEKMVEIVRATQRKLQADPAHESGE